MYYYIILVCHILSYGYVFIWNLLQIIWDEIGESETERNKILLQIKQECLEVYKRKVDQAKLHRAQLQKEISNLESVVTDVCSILGEPQMHIQQVHLNFL